MVRARSGGDCPSLAILERAAVGVIDEALESHLSSCESCSAQLSSIREDNGLLRDFVSANADRFQTDTPAFAPAAIEGYDVIEEIYRGGQGVIFKARQTATKRTVAVKMLLQGAFATDRQRRRFEREIEIAASLRHPNIVTLYESGTTPDGAHYLAMEYVDGVRLDHFVRSLPADRKHLRDLLGLFTKICDAVSAAHRRGIIHRDLKPGNILVDATGEPHVLDFGLAKQAVELDPADRTMTGQFLGTLVYAAPEQVRGDPSATDTRTDVYALGVILFEMLTGARPYELRGGMADAVDTILNALPPSTHSLNSAVDDELDTIVRKTLAKEQDRRYESAGALLADIRRYLAGQPIAAHRDSQWYVLRKAVSRHKVPVTAALLFVATTIGFGVTMAWLYGRAVLAERVASSEREDAIWQTYVANIVGAESAYHARSKHTMRVQLEVAPPEHRDWEWSYLNARADESLRTLRGGEGSVEAVRLSPDGARLYSASGDGTIRVLDVATGDEIMALTGHEGAVHAIDLDGQGTRLVSGGRDGTVRLWNAQTGEQLLVVSEGEFVNAVAFAPGDDRFASAGIGKAITIWRTHDGQKIATLRGHTRVVDGLAFDRSGKHLASAARDGTVRLWDARTGEALATLLTLEGRTEYPGSLSFSPDGDRLVAASYDSTIRIWDVATRRALQTIQADNAGVAHTVAFDPTGTRLITSSADGNLRLWDSVSGESVGRLVGHERDVRSVAFNADGTLVVSSSSDGAIKLWDPAVAERAELRGHERPVYDVVFSPDGTRLLSASLDGTARVWDLATGAQLARLPQSGRAYVVAASADGSLMASATLEEAGVIKLWDAFTGLELETIPVGPGRIKDLVCGEGGTRYLWTPARGSGNEIRIRDGAGGELAVLRGHDDWVVAASWSPDGLRVASGSYDRTVRIWAADTGEELACLRGHDGHVVAVSFSPDGSLLATGSRDQTARLWDLSTGEPLHVLSGHTRDVNALAFSPDGRRLASGSRDGSVKIWDTVTGDVLVTLRGPGRGVNSVAFSPDGTRVASGFNGPAIKVWDSVPWRVRVAERAEALALRAEVEPRVARLLEELGEPSSVATALTAETSLDPSVRRAALTVLLRRVGSEQRSRAGEQ